MKVTGNKSLSSLIKLFLQIVLIMGSAIYIFLPLLLKAYIYYVNQQLNYIRALVLLYVSGIPAIIIVNEFIHMFDTLKKDNPFIKENVRSLKRISICSLIIAMEYAVGIFIVTNSIFTIIIIGVFVIAWLGSYVLAELLQKAIYYKEENDLTI